MRLLEVGEGGGGVPCLSVHVDSGRLWIVVCCGQQILSIEMVAWPRPLLWLFLLRIIWARSWSFELKV